MKTNPIIFARRQFTRITKAAESKIVSVEEFDGFTWYYDAVGNVVKGDDGYTVFWTVGSKQATKPVWGGSRMVYRLDANGSRTSPRHAQ